MTDVAQDKGQPSASNLLEPVDHRRVAVGKVVVEDDAVARSCQHHRRVAADVAGPTRQENVHLIETVIKKFIKPNNKPAKTQYRDYEILTAQFRIYQ